MEYYKELRKYVGHKPIILPGSLVIIVNREGELLLQERNDDFWGLPGGLMELGESLIDTAIREVKEETGLTVSNLTLIDVFSGPQYFFKISNGDEFYCVTALYTTSEYDGNMIPDKIETKNLKFFDVNEMPKKMNKEYIDYMNAYIKTL